MKIPMWFVIAILVICSSCLVAVIMLTTRIQELEREKEAYHWRHFTCRTLLDDPQTRAIMDVKWKRQSRKAFCEKMEVRK